MVSLYLTVNVFDCKQGRMFPEHLSDWSSAELIKILRLSGVAGVLPASYQHNDLVNLFLDRLNVQRPVIYAITLLSPQGTLKNDDKYELILHSDSVQVYGDTINVGLTSKLVRLSNHDCEHVWKEFSKLPGGFSTVIPMEIKETDQRWQILQLTEKLKKLENSDTGRLEEQLKETNKLVRFYRDQVNSGSKKAVTNNEKNSKLIREHQALQAQILLYQNQIDTIRKKLGQNWETELDDLLEAKSRLNTCLQTRQ